MFSHALVTPVTPTPIEEIALALEHIGPLQGIPLEDRLWLARNGQEVCANPGEVLFEEGAQAEHMVIILKGEIHVRRRDTGPMALFIGRTGHITGVLPFSRMKTYGGQGFAVSPFWALMIPRSLFPEMLEAIPSMAQRVVSTLLDRAREVTRIEQQAEKLAALGQLAGNLAHELNNPASAAQRAASSVLAALRANRSNRHKLVGLYLNEQQVQAIEAWEARILCAEAQPLHTLHDDNALAFIAREEAIRAWVGDKNCPDAWEMAAQLAEQGVTAADLDELSGAIGRDASCIMLQFFTRYLRSMRAAETIVNSTARIFDLIDAVKDYSNMDRAPILEVDVPAGLDATLQMFRSRMEHVEVERDYEPGLPRISAYGGELNQVWTALIENALDALNSPERRRQVTENGSEQKGLLRLTCKLEGELLLVEVWDTGPGIPPETPGTHLRTVLHHQGAGKWPWPGPRQRHAHRAQASRPLEREVQPGSTCFRVRLPLDQLQAY